ncbi:MAG: hypothetical protein V7638_4314 [Acidobacteriota bacterium]|jgi:uncharacterized protein YecE (DUF72 family)
MEAFQFSVTANQSLATRNKSKRGLQIGTCGFGVSKKSYANSFSCVEVQQTFYQPPQLSTLERWRSEAWQLITHEARSPTYRRLKHELSASEKSAVGSFRASAIVHEAWDVTVACARALKARTILFQCPASFTPSKENVASFENFFSVIDRHRLNLYWEPRGDWDRDLVRSLCANLALRHVVDPFVSKTVTPDRPYFRLHGRDGWRYKYETSELEELAARLRGKKSGYVFFNNSAMTEDALRFGELIANQPNAS